MYRFFSLLLIVSIGIGCASQGTDTGDETTSDVVVGEKRDGVHLGYGNIPQVVNDRELLRRLSDALRATKLDEELAQGGPYTLFAPVNEAFDAMVPISGDKDNPADNASTNELKELLLNHVVEGKYSAADLIGKNELPTLGGTPIKLGEVSDNVTVDGANVILSDQEADNGYVHLIDSVLVPS